MILEKRIPLGYWFLIAKWDLLFLFLFSGFLFFITQIGFQIKVQISIATFLGTAIALLLSFKLSQSYDRWWEARKIWGEIVNDSRTLVVQLLNFAGEDANVIVKQMAYRQIGWCYALGQNLRRLNTVAELNKFVSQEEKRSLKKQPNIPFSLIGFQARDLKELHKMKQINDFQQIQIDQTLVRLCASMGKAERIKNTIFPKTYLKILKLILYIFFIFLYLSIPELDAPLYKISMVLIIIIPFFILQNIAHNMQDPFENRPSDTAMTQIARNIEINIKALLGESTPAPISTEKYFVM